MLRVLSCLLLCLSMSQALANGSVEDAGVIIHYSATPSLQLTPAVAERYGIERRKNHALVLLSPRKDGQSVSAQAIGVARRLTGERQKLEWRSVEVAGSQDLIAEFKFLKGVQFAIDISVLAQGAPRPIEIRFLRKFYPE